MSRLAAEIQTRSTMVMNASTNTDATTTQRSGPAFTRVVADNVCCDAPILPRVRWFRPPSDDMASGVPRCGPPAVSLQFARRADEVDTRVQYPTESIAGLMAGKVNWGDSPQLTYC